MDSSKTLVKALLLFRGKKYKWITEKLTERTGQKYNPSSFSNRINKGTLTYDEVFAIADILGYKIKIVDTIKNPEKEVTEIITKEE